jgi:transposase, IS5 family
VGAQLEPSARILAEGARAYEFGCKVSIATPVIAPKGGQFVLHAKALHGNPYDGHTLGPVIADLEKLTGVTVRRIHSDKGFVARSGEHGVAAPLGTGTENL